MLPSSSSASSSTDSTSKVAPIAGLKKDGQADLMGRVVTREAYTLALKGGTIDKVRSSSPKGSPARRSNDSSPHGALTDKGSPHSATSSPKDSAKPKNDNSPSPSPTSESPLNLDSPGGSPSSRPRRRSSAGLITNFRNSLPRALMNSQLANSVLNLPGKDDKEWDNLEEFPDTFIIKLSPAELAKVPFSRILNMPPYLLSRIDLEQFRIFKPSEKADFLLRHGQHMDTKFLQALDPKDFELYETRTKISIFCSDTVFPRLSPTFQQALRQERIIHDTENLIPRMTKDEILHIEFDVLNAFAVETLLKLDNACRRVIVDKHYPKLGMVKITYLVSSFTEHDWNLLNPDFIELFLHRRDRESPFPFSNEFHARIKERINCRKEIRKRLEDRLSDPEQKPFDRKEFIDTFTTMLQIPKLTRFRMKPDLFSEAATMLDFDFLKVITDLDAIADHVCASVLNAAFPRFKAKEIIDKIDPLGKVERFYNHKQSKTDLLTNDCRVVIGSLYPCKPNFTEKTKHRLEDPIEDDMVFQKIADENGGHCFALAAARGCRKGFYEKGTIQANRLFIEQIDQYLKVGVGDLISMVRSVILSQQRFLQTVSGMQRTHQAFSEAEVAQSGLIALKVPGEKTAIWQVVSVSVGDHKIFYYSHEQKKCIDITRGNLNHIIGKGDMGGKLGLYSNSRSAHAQSYSDLRNYCVAAFTANDGDLLIPVSQGVHEQMDPQNLCLTPLEACNQLLEGQTLSLRDLLQSEVKESHLQTWTRSPECKLIKEMYVEMMATRLVQKAIKKKENPAVTFAKYCRKTTHHMRAWMEQNPTESFPALGETKDVKIKEALQQVRMIGTLAHYSVAAIELK